jgi:hypothetical protein
MCGTCLSIPEVGSNIIALATDLNRDDLLHVVEESVELVSGMSSSQMPE